MHIKIIQKNIHQSPIKKKKKKRGSIHTLIRSINNLDIAELQTSTK